MPFKYESIQQRVIANSVIAPDEWPVVDGERCWLWIGKTKTNRTGMRYGVITVRFKSGPRKGKVRSVLVHRLVIQEFKGRRMSPRQKGLHRCNNSICCNPAHLVGGTQKANVRQCVREGRHRNGHS